ncbi:probable low affinity copper uptake protein 2 isoform X2 [Gopherus flavomarginatus]|uniref:probable low affinity copper uptake protein 2 isoform X2 n=1 Tax=Gopherus flavomarginatus TaxID=286002 RepID=UPI0021CBE12A|nr:probable low affinity copper uptake protein 2 isoform X2 [Gopherus flavomarginatus]XP_050782396.1 probable low affinity copper uptake protein 2 isoform X2 [Gopherus flavomarginatus]
MACSMSPFSGPSKVLAQELPAHSRLEVRPPPHSAAPEELSGLGRKMYFYFSDKVVLLFDFWNVRTPAGMVLSVLVVLLLAMLYEAIKISKSKLLRQTILAIPTTLSQESLRELETGSVNSNLGQQNTTSKRWFLYHISQSLLHVAQVVIGYLVMLVVMSYNTWIFLGVIVGSTLGYYLAYPVFTSR